MNSNITYVSSKKLSKTTVDFINNFVDSRADLTDEQKIVRKKELIQEYETKGEDFFVKELKNSEKAWYQFWK